MTNPKLYDDAYGCWLNNKEGGARTRDAINAVVDLVAQRTCASTFGSFWVVETSDPSLSRYYCLQPGLGWSADIDDALHFRREVEAKRFIRQYIGDSAFSAVEHKYVSLEPK